MEFEKIKPRKILENETVKDYECYLRDFYYHLNPPKPMNRYDFAYQNNLVDSAEVMDGKNGKYVKYLEHYYSNYYRKLDKKINRTLKKYNKNQKKDNIFDTAKNFITTKAINIKNSIQKRKENYATRVKSKKDSLLNSTRSFITTKTTNIKNSIQERKINQTKIESENSSFQPENIVAKALNVYIVGVSAILLAASISAIMNHSIALGITGTIISLVGASIAGVIDYHIKQDNHESLESKKKEKMQLFTKKKKQSKAKDKLLSLFTRKKNDKKEDAKNNESNDDMFEFDLNTAKEEKEPELAEEPFFDFDLSAINHNEDVNPHNLESVEPSKSDNDMFEFDLNKVENNDEIKVQETAKVKVMKR